MSVPFADIVTEFSLVAVTVIPICGSVSSILSVLLLPICPTLFLLDIYAAFTIQLLFIVNAPLYTVPFVALGSVPFVVYLIVSLSLVSIVTSLFCVHVSLFAIVIDGAVSDSVLPVISFVAALPFPALSYTFTNIVYDVCSSNPVTVNVIPPSVIFTISIWLSCSFCPFTVHSTLHIPDVSSVAPAVHCESVCFFFCYT